MQSDEKNAIIANLHKLFGNAFPKSTIEKVLDQQTQHIQNLEPENQEKYVDDLINDLKNKQKK